MAWFARNYWQWNWRRFSQAELRGSKVNAWINELAATVNVYISRLQDIKPKFHIVAMFVIFDCKHISFAICRHINDIWSFTRLTTMVSSYSSSNRRVTAQHLCCAFILYTNITWNNSHITYFSKLYFHASFQYHKISGAGIATVLQVRLSTS